MKEVKNQILQKVKAIGSPRKEPASPAFKTKSERPSLSMGDRLKKLGGIQVTPDVISNWIHDFSSHEKSGKEKENTASSPSPRPRRNSIIPRLGETESEDPKGGKMYVGISDLKHKVKGSKDGFVVYLVVNVMRCTLATSPVDYASHVTFEEGFLFDIHGTFNVKIEVFIQSKEKGKEAVYEMPESLGTLNFDGLSVINKPIKMITGSYFLTKEGKDTETSITLQVAIKPHDIDDIERESLPAPDFAKPLSHQVASSSSYNWVLDDCELRGRTLRFYSDNKKVKTVRMDARTKAQKADTRESEISLPYNSFQIIANGAPVYLVAQTPDDMKEWIEKLNKGAQAAF